MYLRMVTSSLVRRRSRVFVALLAVMVGATTLSGLVTVYRDVPRQMGREFRSYGANLVLVPAGEATALSSAQIELATAVLAADDVVGVAPYRYETVKINEQPFMAAGTDLAEAKQVSPYWYVAGDWPSGSGDLLIGQDVADLIGLQPGQTATLTGVDDAGEDFTADFSVTGVLQTGGAEDGFVFMGLSDLEAVMGSSDEVDVVEYSVTATQEELDSAALRITEGVAGVSAGPVKRVAESEASVLGTLQSLVYLVTLIVLALTMICVSTTMMAVVAERRREIGLKKALGASNRSVVWEFLGEGLLLGGVGGLLGSLCGFVFAQAVSMNVFGRGIAFQFALIPVTVLVSLCVTGLACLLPVRRATDVQPAIVLRGE